MSISITGIEDIQKSALEISNKTSALLEELTKTAEVLNEHILLNITGELTGFLDSANESAIAFSELAESIGLSTDVLVSRIDSLLFWITWILIPFSALVLLALAVCLISYGVSKLRGAPKPVTLPRSYDEMPMLPGTKRPRNF